MAFSVRASVVVESVEWASVAVVAAVVPTCIVCTLVQSVVRQSVAWASMVGIPDFHICASVAYTCVVSV